MKSRRLQFDERVRQSYWFLPSIMAVVAVFLAGAVIWLDPNEGSD